MLKNRVWIFTKMKFSFEITVVNSKNDFAFYKIRIDFMKFPMSFNEKPF